MFGTMSSMPGRSYLAALSCSSRRKGFEDQKDSHAFRIFQSNFSEEGTFSILQSRFNMYEGEVYWSVINSSKSFNDLLVKKWKLLGVIKLNQFWGWSFLSSLANIHQVNSLLDLVACLSSAPRTMVPQICLKQSFQRFRVETWCDALLEGARHLIFRFQPWWSEVRNFLGLESKAVDFYCSLIHACESSGKNAVILLLNQKTNAKSGSVDRGFVVSIVGEGVGVVSIGEGVKERISKKRTKNKAKNDKTEHGIGKSTNCQAGNPHQTLDISKAVIVSKEAQVDIKGLDKSLGFTHTINIPHFCVYKKAQQQEDKDSKKEP
ncbi:hypothetical protein Tco_0938864 [Tanacetum coccineum]|uniref:Uncharacterized protein n=1 Tax=Tanacetum coccineum TaxID=301880 RepID=A0ABQ5DPL4_9ASTR